MNEYFEKESLGKLMAKFCLPCIASLLISCLYNIADQMFVGNGIGYVANAATGIIFPLTVLGWGLSLLFGDGAAAAFSLSGSADESRRCGRYTAQAVWMTFVSGLVITVLFLLFPEGILRLAGASDAVLGMAKDYGTIILLFMPLAMVQNAMAPLIRADGAPGYTMMAMVCGTLFNIVGDWLAIFVWNLGIQGAAWATVLGQVLSLIICILYFVRADSSLIHWSDFKAQKELDLHIARLGTSSFLSQFSIVVITIVNNILLVHYGALSQYGSEIPLAAFVVLMKLFQIVINIAIGIAAGCQPIAGNNFAAGQEQRVRSLFFRMCLATLIVGLVSTSCFFLFTRQIVSMFGAQDELYMQFAVQVVRIYLSLITLTCLQKVCAIFMQSVGQAGKASFLSILRDGLLVIFAIVFPLFGGLDAIFYSAVAADLCAALITAVVMVRFFVKMPVLIREQQFAGANA